MQHKHPRMEYHPTRVKWCACFLTGLKFMGTKTCQRSTMQYWPPLTARPDHPWLQRHNQFWLSRPDKKPIQDNSSKLSLSKDELFLMSHTSHDRRMGSLARWSISESVPTSQKSQKTMKQILISILPSVSLKRTCKWFCEEDNIVHKPTTQLLWDLYASPTGYALYPDIQLFLWANANSRFYTLKPPVFLH